jgi:uncharacterized protein
MGSFICITGAAGGLGKAFALECGARGWDIFLTDIRRSALEEVAREVSCVHGVRVLHAAADLSKARSRERLCAAMGGEDRRFWGLINVAGLDFQGPFLERSTQEMREILRVNAEASLELTQFALRLRDADRPFRLINVSSLAAYSPMPTKAVYAASKGFLLSFSLALREELRDSSATVTVLCPAGLATNDESVRDIEAQGLLGRLTTVDVGRVVACTLDRALRGRAMCVPGLANQFLRLLKYVLPPTAGARLLAARWRADLHSRRSADTRASAHLVNAGEEARA